MVIKTKGADMPRRAYSYLRYSSAHQRKGDSERRQLEWAPAFCKRKGWYLADDATIRDEGMSGYRKKNIEVGRLGAFLADVQANLIPRGSVLLIEALDRLSRAAVMDAFRLFSELLEAGISIQVQDPERYYDADKELGFFDALEVLFRFAEANAASERKSTWAKSKWAARRAAARSEKTPRGKWVPAWIELVRGRYELRPGPAATIRAILERAIEGHGTLAILAWLASNPAHPSFGKSGRWTVRTIQNILKKREILGEYQPRIRDKSGAFVPEGAPIVDYYPRLATEAEWLQVQAGLAARRVRVGRPSRQLPNLFKGMCWHAGYREKVCKLGEGEDRRGNHYHYLGLTRDKIAVLGPDRHPRWRYEPFEDAMLEAIEELELRAVLPPGADRDGREARIAELSGRLVLLDHRAGQLKALMADPLIPADEAGAAFDSLRAVMQDQKATAAERDRLKLESDAGRGEGLTQLQSLVQLWREAKGTGQEVEMGDRIKLALARVVDAIWVLPQRFSRFKSMLHVQIYLRSGVRRYLQILPPCPPAGLTAWQLEDCDFRAGDVGDAARAPAALA